MPKRNYKITQDSELITSESESGEEEESFDTRSAQAESHRTRKRIYYDRSRSRSVECIVQRSTSPPEERPRKKKDATRYERERPSGHRSQHRDETYQTHRVPRYEAWSTEKTTTKKRYPKEHSVHRSQPATTDKRKVIEKREKRATVTQPIQPTPQKKSGNNQ